MLFQLFNTCSLDQLRLTKDDRAWESMVLVFAGTMDKFEYDIFSQLPFHVSCSRPFDSMYGLPVHEVKDYSIVLVGHQSDIDRILSDDFLLLQAHIVAYPATCPQCGSAILPIAAGCGEVNWDGICKKCSTVYMVSNGDLLVYDVKTQFFVRVGFKAALAQPTSGQLMVDKPEYPPYSNQERFGTPYKSATSIVPVDSETAPASAPLGLPDVEIIATWVSGEGRYKATYSGSEATEPESPDPPPKTWRQLPPQF